MLDIETLGTKPGSTILSIGACQFSFETGLIGETFEIAISARSCVKAGLTTDIETFMWWLEQSKEAQNSFLDRTKFPLSVALEEFSKFVINTRTNTPRGEIGVWGNDNTFDLVLTEHAFDACKKTVPWNYWESRSVRTLVFTAEQMTEFSKVECRRTGTHHSAVDDAVFQAEYCIKAWNLINAKTA